MSLQTLALTVMVGAVAGLIVHELGHVLAAGALGGSGFRLRRIWPAVRIEAQLPPGTMNEAVFLVGGVFANLGAAGALIGFGGVFAVAGVLQLLVAATALLPIGESDGARLWRLWRGQGPVGM